VLRFNNNFDGRLHATFDGVNKCLQEHDTSIPALGLRPLEHYLFELESGCRDQMHLCNDDLVEARVLFGAVLEIQDAHG
jgi:hypothetical protein